MEDINKIRERVAKLLAMAADSSSPEEAAIAASSARELMDKHQIELADVQQLDQAIMGHATARGEYKYSPKWKNILAVAVAKYNDCIARLARGSKPGFYQSQFQGYKDDADMALIMFERLCEAIDGMCRKYMKQVGHGSHYIASVANPYKYGMAKRLCAKLEALTTERDQLTAEAGTSLVLVKSVRVTEEFGDPGYKTVKGPSMRKNQVGEVRADVHAAYIQGWVDGETVQVNEQVSE